MKTYIHDNYLNDQDVNHSCRYKIGFVAYILSRSLEKIDCQSDVLYRHFG